MQIVPAGAPGNTSGVTALVQNCTGPLPILRTTGYLFPTGCPCAFGPIGGGFNIAGTSSTGYLGTWNGVVDFTDPSNATTPAVAQADIYLVKTPLVAVLHGFKSDCDGVETLRQNLVRELEIAGDRVRCYKYGNPNGYNWQDGIATDAAGLGPWLGNFVGEVDPSQSEVDIVAHS